MHIKWISSVRQRCIVMEVTVCHLLYLLWCLYANILYITVSEHFRALFILTIHFQPFFSFLGFGDNLFPVSQHLVPAAPRVASKQLRKHRPRIRRHERLTCERPARRRRHRQPSRQVMTSEFHGCWVSECACMCKSCLNAECVNVCVGSDGTSPSFYDNSLVLSHNDTTFPPSLPLPPTYT